MRATISDLWNRLREYLHKVRAGKTMPMLDRGRAIARIERIDGRQAFDERLLRLEAAGLVRRPSRSLPVAVRRSRLNPAAACSARSSRSGRAGVEFLVRGTGRRGCALFRRPEILL